MSCTYNEDSQKLTVIDPVTSDITGTSITFEVSDFVNPYSGKPRTGYYIVTTDSVGGEIDSSNIAGIDISLQVTDWASLSGALVGRDDDIKTVGDLSAGSIYFALDFPVDAGCRVEIKFPSDMPLTSDLTSLSSSGIITKLGVAPTSTSLATNTFYLDGCSSYSS